MQRNPTKTIVGSTQPTKGKVAQDDRVAPILGRRFVKCHMENGNMGPPPEGLRLDTYESVVAGRDRALVTPGNPDASELVRSIRGQSLPRMPFDGSPYLDEAEIKLITDWIEQGARNADGTEATLPVGAKVRLGGRHTGKWNLDRSAADCGRSDAFKEGPRCGRRCRSAGCCSRRWRHTRHANQTTMNLGHENHERTRKTIKEKKAIVTFNLVFFISCRFVGFVAIKIGHQIP